MTAIGRGEPEGTLISYQLHHRVGSVPAQLKFQELERELRVEIVFVPAPQRKQGIGKLLMSRVIELSEVLGKPVRLVARPLGVTSADALEKLIGFYESLGFRIVARQAGAAEMERPVASRGARAERG